MLRRWILPLALLVAFACGLRPAYAGPPLNSQPNLRLAEFLAEPAAVAVDVVDLSSGTQVANNVAATQVQRDAADTIAWKYDLATVSGYPTGCAPKTYLVTFVPDAAECSEAGTPELCASEIVQVGGSACLAESSPVSIDPEYATSAIPGQGISQKVVDFHARRGLLTEKWRKILVAADLDFATPDATLWEVLFWTDGNEAPRIKCRVVTTSDPAVSLPSSSHCG
jgi:hypothetical protein